MLRSTVLFSSHDIVRLKFYGSNAKISLFKGTSSLPSVISCLDNADANGPKRVTTALEA